MQELTQHNKKELLESLAISFDEANKKYVLLEQLMTKWKQSDEGLSQYWLFWETTTTTYQESLIVHLFKLYDKRTKTFSLYHFLNEHFKEWREGWEYLFADGQEAKTTYENDMKWVSDNPALKKLTIWRGSMYGHANLKTLIGENKSLNEVFYMHEIQTLIQRGYEILKRYGDLVTDISGLAIMTDTTGITEQLNNILYPDIEDTL